MSASLWARLFGRTDDAGQTPPNRAALLATLADELEQLDIFELPAVVAGRQLIADVAATLPMVAHDGRRRLDPTPSLLRRPDPAMPARRFVESVVNAMTRHGVAWLEVTVTGSNGYPLAVAQVRNERVTWQLSPNGQRVQFVWIDGQPADLDRIRWVGYVHDGDPVGTTPLETVRTVLRQQVEVFRYSADYYGTAAVPPYAVVHPNRLTAEQSTAMMDQWLLARSERRPALLSGGVSLETYGGQSASDAMLLDAVNYLDAMAARVLQIPPSLLNVVSQSSLTYSNTTDEFRRWLQLGLYPGVLARLEGVFTDLLPRGQEALFDTSNLVRMDLAQRMSTYGTALAAGVYSINEVRALEGLPVTPDADPVPVQPNVEGI